MHPDQVLNVIDLRKSFGHLIALDGVSLSVDEKTVSILIGPNGSGKTTLINVITGFHHPDSGKVEFNATDVTGWQPHELYNIGIARTFQIPALFWKLTVLENLLVAEKKNPGESFGKAILQRFWETQEEAATEKAAKILEMLGLSDHSNDPGLSSAEDR